MEPPEFEVRSTPKTGSGGGISRESVVDPTRASSSDELDLRPRVEFLQNRPFG